MSIQRENQESDKYKKGFQRTQEIKLYEKKHHDWNEGLILIEQKDEKGQDGN